MKLTRQKALEQGYHLCGNPEVDNELIVIDGLDEEYIKECSESDEPLYLAEKEPYDERNGMGLYNLTEIQLIP